MAERRSKNKAGQTYANTLGEAWTTNRTFQARPHGKEEEMFRRREEPPPTVPLGSAVSRYDFVDSLRLLGARLSVPQRCETGRVQYEQQEVLLNCSREIWERVIGPPRNIICHYSPAKRGIYHSWEHHWVGGGVRCFGCLFERASDSRWLFLSRVVFFNHPADMQPRRRTSRRESTETPRQPA